MMKIFDYIIEPIPNRKGVWKAMIKCDVEAVNRIEDILQDIEDDDEEDDEENDKY